MDTVCIDKRSGIPEKRNHVYDDGTLIFVGACIGCVSVYTYGAYGAFIGFVPLIVARLFMYIGKIPVENGTPEETEEEAKKHSKRQICWRTIRNCDRSPQNLCGASLLTEYSEYADQDV